MASEIVEGIVNKILSRRIFLGRYEERRYVQVLQDYRDVIVIDSSESELIKDLEIIRYKVRNHIKSFSWIGITYPDLQSAPSGYCFWVQLNIPFGLSWFQIKSGRSDNRTREFILQIKSIRYLNESEGYLLCGKKESTSQMTLGSLQNEPSEQSTLQDGSTNQISTNDQKKIDYAILENSINHGISFVKQVLCDMLEGITLANTVEFFKLFIATLYVFSFYTITFIGHIGVYFLRLLSELRNLIHVSTPIILSLIDAVTKCIGGFYILLAMIWRDSRQKSNTVNSNIPQLKFNQDRPKYRRRTSSNFKPGK